MNLIEVLNEIYESNKDNISFINQNYFSNSYKEKLNLIEEKKIFNLIKSLFPDFLRKSPKFNEKSILKENVSILYNELNENILNKLPLIIQTTIYKAYWNYLHDYSSALKVIQINKEIWLKNSIKSRDLKYKKFPGYLKEALKLSHLLKNQKEIKACSDLIENEIEKFYEKSKKKDDFYSLVLELIEILFECNDNLSLSHEKILLELTKTKYFGINLKSYELLIALYKANKEINRLNKIKNEYFNYKYQSIKDEKNFSKLNSLKELFQECQKLFKGKELKEKRKQLQKEIRILEKEFEERLITFNKTIDISDLSFFIFKNDFNQCISLLANLTNPSNLLKLANENLKNESNLLNYLFPTVHLDREGRFITPIFKEFDEKDIKRAQLFSEMNSIINIEGTIAQHLVWLLKLKFGIDLLLDKILSENPIIPKKRKNIFKIGFKLGFQGEFYASAHILLIQFENLIREILLDIGIDPFELKETGDSSAHLLNYWLEKNPEVLNDYFGKDTVIFLQALLVDKYGGNLRNDFAHALRDEDLELNDYIFFFTWLLSFLYKTNQFYKTGFNTIIKDERKKNFNSFRNSPNFYSEYITLKLVKKYFSLENFKIPITQMIVLCGPRRK